MRAPARLTTTAALLTTAAALVTTALPTVALAGGGMLDQSFGSGGVAGASTNPKGPLVAVLPGSTGDITAVIGAQYGPMVRYDATGQVVSSFTTPAVSQTPVRAFAGPGDDITVVTQLQGSAGVLRITHDGAADTTYGANGFATVSVPGGILVTDAALSPDGSVVIAGTPSTSGATTGTLVRLTTSGALDTTFDPAGTTPGQLTTADSVRAVAVDAAGRTLTACGWDWSRTDPCLTRYTADGSVDATFGMAGSAPALPVTGLPRFSRLLVDAAGRLVALGTEYNGGHALVARFTSDGAVDDAFGTHGITEVPVAGAGTPCYLQGMLDASDGIWAAGSDCDQTRAGAFVTHVQPTGQVDTAFAHAGSYYYGDSYTRAPHGLALDSAGNLLVGLALAGDNSGNIAVARVTTVGLPAPGGATGAGTATGASVSWQIPDSQSAASTVVRWAPGATAPATADAGTAAYSGSGTSTTIALPVTGQDVAVSVFTRDYAGATSAPAVVHLHGTRLTTAVSPSKVAYGTTVTVSTTLTRVSGATAVSGVPVALFARRHGATAWGATPVKTASTDVYGRAKVALTATANTDYQWRFNGAHADLHAASPAGGVTVATRISATYSRTSAPLGTTITVTGAVSPNHYRQPVLLQRYYSGGWHTVATAYLSSTSTYRFTVRPAARATYPYRVYKAADTDHAAAWTATANLRIY